MTWEQERDLVLYKLEELKLAHMDSKRAQEEDRKILKSIESKLLTYQASVKTLKWASGAVGGLLVIAVEWAFRFLKN